MCVLLSCVSEGVAEGVVHILVKNQSCIAYYKIGWGHTLLREAWLSDGMKGWVRSVWEKEVGGVRLSCVSEGIAEGVVHTLVKNQSWSIYDYACVKQLRMEREEFLKGL